VVEVAVPYTVVVRLDATMGLNWNPLFTVHNVVFGDRVTLYRVVVGAL
jgi:hypothetical protein